MRRPVPGDVLHRLCAVTGISILLVVVVMRGIGIGDTLADVIGFIASAIFLLVATFVDPQGGSITPETVRRIRAAARIQWEQEAKGRDLLGNLLLPINAFSCAHPELRISPHGELPAVTAADFQQAWADLFAALPAKRMVIEGPGGSGKSTLALLATLGLLNRTSGPVPLMLPVGAWEAGREPFLQWVGRRLDVALPSTREVAGRGAERIRRLLANEAFMLVLDGTDELPHEGAEHLPGAILREVPADCPVVVLGRSSKDALHWERHRFDRYELEQPSPEQVQRYLAAVSAAEKKELQILPVDLALFYEEVARPASPLLRALSTPLRIYLVRKAIRDGSTSTQQILKDLASVSGSDVEQVVQRVALQHLATTVRKSRYLSRVDTEGYLRRLALLLNSHGGDESAGAPAAGRSLAWWRVGDVVPSTVFGVGLSLFALPAYLLATVMPEGLTRGFAIGVVAGISFGVLRGITLSTTAVVITALTIGGIVLSLGTNYYGWKHGATDTAQLTIAMLGVICFRRPIITRSAGLVVLLLTATSTGSAAASILVAQACHFEASDRTFVAIFLADLLGLGVATGSARALLPSAWELRPSPVQFWAGVRLEAQRRSYAAGLLSAIAVGTAGGLVGALKFDTRYGIALALWFGLVAGIPVGLVGGTIRHLAAPPRHPEYVARTASLAIDRLVSLGIIVTVGIVAGAAIEGSERITSLADAINQSSKLDVRPIHGTLFGLTIGVIVAGYNAAWLNYTIAHKWLFVRGLAPWRLDLFLRKLWEAEILRRENYSYAFRHEEYQRALAAAPDDWLDRAGRP